MSKRKAAIIFVITLFIFLALSIVYITTELYTESEVPEVKVSDSQKFKEAFEKYNNQEIEGNKIIELDIPVGNPFVETKLSNINKMMDDKESFIVFFASPTCNNCRSVIGSLISAAKEKNIKKIYYVNMDGHRDTYELNDKHQAVRTVEGSADYYKALTLFDNILDYYGSLKYTNKKGKEVIVDVEEKRIITPSIIVVKDGVAIAKESGNIEECYIKEAYRCLLDRWFTGEPTTQPATCDLSNVCAN